MIFVFVMAGMVCAMFAGIASLALGHPWWMVLASYSLTGLIAVPLLALLAWGLRSLCHTVRTSSLDLQSLTGKH